MKFKITKNNIIDTLKFYNNITSLFNSSSPILNCVLVIVKYNKIEFLSSNNILSTKININSNFECIEEGSFLIKGKIFYNIINKLNNEKITFEKIDNNLLMIKCNKYESLINLYDEKDYPIIDYNYENWEKIEINSDDIKIIEKKIIPCVSNNQEKITIFNNILFDSETFENQIYFVGTDSYKLSLVKKKFNGKKIKFLLLPYIIKIISEFSKNNELIEFYFNEQKIIIKFGEYLIFTKVFNGLFPNISSLIKNEYIYRFSINKKELIDSIERGLIISNNDKKSICNWKINDDKLSLNFKCNEIGTSFDEIKIENESQIDISFEINSNFFLTLTKIIDSDYIDVQISGVNKPIQLREKGNNNFLAIIIPLRKK